MEIVEHLCRACGDCIPYCPVGAIRRGADGRVRVIAGDCVECDICRMSGICPTAALETPELAWPRLLRQRFSNPLLTHPETGVPGRGTEEMKTNDVTGRLARGWAAVVVELGRPGTGASFRDVEIVTTALAGLGVRFEPANPVTALIASQESGRLRPDVLDERVLSAIVEVEVRMPALGAALTRLRAVAGDVDTVFSVGVSARLDADGRNPAAAAARAAGFSLSPNGKTNVGLGRPAHGGGA